MEIFAVFFGTGDICKFINRTFDFYLPPLYNLLPDLSLPAEKDNRSIGIWGQRRLRHLKQYHKAIYYNLLTSGKLHSHLADVEEQAQYLFYRLVKEYAEKEGITEQLKSTDQMKWVGKMSAIRNAATEIINRELIYT